MKKVISISLALILLLGHVGITYGTHYCMGSVMKAELMIGHEHMDCGMGDMDTPAHDENEPHFEAPACCENQYQTLEIDEPFNKTIAQSIDVVFVATLAYSLTGIDLHAGALSTDFTDYPPPIPDKDISVLFQVFRI